jgi:hypothetical protein
VRFDFIAAKKASYPVTVGQAHLPAPHRALDA